MLVLALAIALLSTLSVIGVIAQGLIQQQRLNNLADAAALAGAQEIEFNPGAACIQVELMVNRTTETQFSCELNGEHIYVDLTQPTSSNVLRLFRPAIFSSAHAGLATSIETQ